MKQKDKVSIRVVCFYDTCESRSVMPDSLQSHGLSSSWNSPGQNTGVGRLFLLQGIFPSQGWNQGLLHCRWILYQLNHKGSTMSLTQYALIKEKERHIFQVKLDNR